jgi:antitoxin (DNA-binding transcriptional repressor) of toxin-antitoxin stability system
MATHEDKPVARIVGQFLELHKLWMREPIQDHALTPVERSMGEKVARMTPVEKQLCADLISDGRQARREATGQSQAIGARREHEPGHRPGFWRRLWTELRWFLEDN